ncbi:DNA alkylation repair protein [Bacillus sp. FJAT-27264]|uniref:DNA alkylation repair protein n=1 Tax=Paenibacillus sp. (strain DSM 101736 / FJAT-27264) TaxID=1850362 RepID=UPI000807CD86|nr:DNA alkylation repair protein [Bacillus sp. FJAT-27264]OBZ11673.1 DNA alkylation repair protein [Bacillus sp. FJAT-27264]
MDKTIREQLLLLTDADYQKFSAGLIPNVSNILGVRLPELRKLAKGIARGEWRAYLEQADSEYFEEIMLLGMVIGYASSIKNADIEEILKYIAAFVPKIDNWSVCDSFCIGLKFTSSHRDRVWDFLQPYLASDQEYEIRFAVVMLLNFYVEADDMDRVLVKLDVIKHEGYYVKMAVAWALSVCYVKHPERVMTYLKHNFLDDFTFNKALQKITESYRASSEDKQIIRSMKRR